MHCEPADNFASIKLKTGKLLGIDPGQIGLFATRDKVIAHFGVVADLDSLCMDLS
ncbi:unnamed protein product [Discosporangium mesarthrocarpum]